MTSAKDIVVFGRHAAQRDVFASAPDRRLEGDCTQSVENHYSDPTSQFHAGVWSGGLGRWRVHYTEHEFCTLLEGRCRLTDEHGHTVELHAGDHFVIPAGFVGTWEVLEPARKTYAIFEPKKS